MKSNVVPIIGPADDIETRAEAGARELSRLQVAASELATAAEAAERAYSEAPSEELYIASMKADRAATIGRDQASAYHAKIAPLLGDAEDLRRSRRYAELAKRMNWRDECRSEIEAFTTIVSETRTRLDEAAKALNEALAKHRATMRELAKVSPNPTEAHRAGKHLEGAVSELSSELATWLGCHVFMHAYDADGPRMKFEIVFPRGAQ